MHNANRGFGIEALRSRQLLAGSALQDFEQDVSDGATWRQSTYHVRQGQRDALARWLRFESQLAPLIKRLQQACIVVRPISGAGESCS